MKTKILTSLIIIGIVGAFATGSSMAALNDFENSMDNLFHAGAVDIKIGWEESINGQSEEQQHPTDNPGTIFDVKNITPGDHGEATISIDNTANPAYLWFKANQTSNDENEYENKTEEVKKPSSKCGPISGLNRGDYYHVKNGKYVVEQRSDTKVKLTKVEGEKLGKNGEKESQTFKVRVNGDTDETVYMKLSAGKFKGVAKLEGEGDTTTDSSALWELKLKEIVQHDDGSETYVIEVTSDSAERTFALDSIKFSFCDRLTQDIYYEVDVTEAEEPRQNFVKDGTTRQIDGFGSDYIEGIVGNSKEGLDDSNRIQEKWYRHDCVSEFYGFESAGKGKVKASFKVSKKCSLTIATYSKPHAKFIKERMWEQVLYDSTTRVFEPGKMHELVVNVPTNPDEHKEVEDDGTEEEYKKTIPDFNDTTSEEGELGQNLEFTLWYDDGDNVKQSNEQLIFEGTSHELDQYDIGEGLLLDGDTEQEGIQSYPNGTSHIGFRWELPEDTGCKVQTDSKTFDFTFNVKQSRHNNNPIMDSIKFFGDTETSKDNYFKAGTFEGCDNKQPVNDTEPPKPPVNDTNDTCIICGPVVEPEEGSKDVERRHGKDKIKHVSYKVVKESTNSVKFEDSTYDGSEKGLGENGNVETDTFKITVKGDSNETVYIKTKAGQQVGTAMLQGEGDTKMDTAGLWNLKLADIEKGDNKTTYTIKVTSDSEEGQQSPALSYIEFQFCEPIEKRPYWQLDLTEGEIHEPAEGYVDETLFMAALSDSNYHDKLNPSLFRENRKPKGLKLNSREFNISEKEASVGFTVEEGHEIKLSLASYTMPGPYRNNQHPEMNEQELYDSKTVTFEPGDYEFKVDIPGGKYPDAAEDVCIPEEQPEQQNEKKEESHKEKDRKKKKDHHGHSEQQNEEKNHHGEKDKKKKKGHHTHSTEQGTENSDKELVGHWKFDGSTGGVKNELGGHAHNRGAQRAVSGAEGNSFKFDGDDYVEVPDSSKLDTEEDLTVSAWVKSEGGGKTPHSIVQRKESGPSRERGYVFRIHDTSKHSALELFVADGTQQDFIADYEFGEHLGEWTHVAAVANKTHIMLYVNGERTSIEEREVSPMKFDREGDMRIGALNPEGGQSAGFKGKIDDVRIYSSSLPSQEVKKLHQQSVN